MLGKNERSAALGQGIAKALLDDARGCFAAEREMLFLDRQIGAGKESNQVHGIGSGPRFIEIVHTPDEPAFEVAPSAEILDVQITNGQDLRCAREFGADDRPPLRPAIEGGAQEWKSRAGHVAVLEVDVGADEFDVPQGPFFEVRGGVDDVGQFVFVWLHECANRLCAR